MLLSLENGMTPDQWAEAGEQAIVTALDLLEERNRQANGKQPAPSGGPQMSG